MKSRNLIEQLKTLPYFSKDTLGQLGGQLGLKNTTVDVYISRFLKFKEITKLRRGLYISTDFYNKNKVDISYQFYLANILRKPSYVTSWTALQYYNFTTEIIPWQLISVTPKITKKYEVRGVGTFSYQSIKKELFTDYSLVKGKFDFFIASPSKALFDLLYFITHQFRGIDFEDVKKMVEDLRIDFNEMSKTEQNKFFCKIKEYLYE